jgi:hypothetical protein
LQTIANSTKTVMKLWTLDEYDFCHLQTMNRLSVHSG